MMDVSLPCVGLIPILVRSPSNLYRDRISARDALRHPYILLYSPHIKRVHHISASGEHTLVRSGSKDSLTGVSITNTNTPSSLGANSSYNYSSSAASTPPPANNGNGNKEGGNHHHSTSTGGIAAV